MSPKRRTRNSTSDASLEEKLRLLTVENQMLRQYIADHGVTDFRLPKLPNEEQEIVAKKPNGKTASLTPSGVRGCSCKGNCSTRLCGCVKKNVPCAEFCRCGSELCQNSEPDKENIGDVNKQSQLSKDGEESLARLANLTVADNNKKPNRKLFNQETKTTESDAAPLKKNKKKIDNKKTQKKRINRISSDESAEEASKNDDRSSSESETAARNRMNSDRTRGKSLRKKENPESESQSKAENMENIAIRKVKVQKLPKNAVNIVESLPKEDDNVASGSGSKTEERGDESTSVEPTKMGNDKKNTNRADEDLDSSDDYELNRVNVDAQSRLAIPQDIDEFDPMKPRRQLPRSPIAPTISIFAPRDTITLSPQAAPAISPKKEPTEQTPEPPDLANPVVNWDEHLANLVECKKCKRTFLPERIEKHETFCQNV